MVVKRLTALTVLLMVPTLLAGIYGMNFVNMPELYWTFGYYAALGLMAFLVGGLVLVFRRIGWL